MAAWLLNDDCGTRIYCCIYPVYLFTIVYPAKGQPGSQSSKLDSGAQKRLRQSHTKATGHVARPARDWPVLKLVGVRACGRARKLGPRAFAQSSAVVSVANCSSDYLIHS